MNILSKTYAAKFTHLCLSDTTAICRPVCPWQRRRFGIDEAAFFGLGSADGREVPSAAAARLDGLLSGLSIASLPLSVSLSTSFNKRLPLCFKN